MHHKIAPGSAGFDENGFRNIDIRVQYDIVAIGDSQTYGTLALISKAWPQQLEAATGLSVYNMAVGGYGPVQYARLLDQAFALQPKYIFIGLYFGNDIYDAYSMSHEKHKPIAKKPAATLSEAIRKFLHHNSGAYRAFKSVLHEKVGWAGADQHREVIKVL